MYLSRKYLRLSLSHIMSRNQITFLEKTLLDRNRGRQLVSRVINPLIGRKY